MPITQRTTMPKPLKQMPDPSFVNEETNRIEEITRLKGRINELLEQMETMKAEVKRRETVDAARATGRTYDRFEAIITGWAAAGKLDPAALGAAGGEQAVTTLFKHAIGLARKATQIIEETK